MELFPEMKIALVFETTAGPVGEDRGCTHKKLS
jgi:hypothetical protein